MEAEAEVGAAVTAVVAEVVSEVRQELAGFSLDWVELGDDSPGVGTTIGDGEYRTRTGASIVAVIRNARPLPSPGPEFTFFPGDIAIIVGSKDEVHQVRSSLCG